MPPCKRHFWFAVLCCILLACGSALGQDEEHFQRLLDEKSPAIVTIKCVLKLKSGRNDKEMQSENSGVMIDPKGLVLCSNSRLGGAYGVTRRLYAASASGISITPTDIKVIVGDAAEGVDAKFVARDTELDLAWIQIKEPGDKAFADVDLSKGSTAKVGQRVFSIYRANKYFDRAPMVLDTAISGVIKKPREMYRAGDVSAALGLPAFAADGRVVGIHAMVVPESDEESDAQSIMLDRSVNSQQYSGGLLPVSEVVKATARAKESAASEPASEESSEETSTTKPAKAGKKSDGQKDTTKEK